jgi:hypothetical protein
MALAAHVSVSEAPTVSSDDRRGIVAEVFDTQAAADYLQVSSALLEYYRVRGGGPRYSKLGRLVRYRRAALDEWLKELERSSTSDIGGQA